MNSLVSVIIPVYNVEKYLDKCIYSVVNQTYNHLEIILIDDGSTDGCPAICDKWANVDGRIRIIHCKNAGVGAARNFGLDVASGDFISFVDSDDYLPTDSVEYMVDRIENDNSDLVIAQFVKCFTDGRIEDTAYSWMNNKIITQNEALQLLGDVKNRLPVSPCAKLYRKELFQDLRFNSLKCSEDEYIFPHILEKCNNISTSNKVVYYYFQRDTSTVHTKTYIQKMDSLIAILHVARFLFDHNCIEGARTYYFASICAVSELKNDKQAKDIILKTFSPSERKILKAKINKNQIVSLLAAFFPKLYKFYKKVITR